MKKTIIYSVNCLKFFIFLKISLKLSFFFLGFFFILFFYKLLSYNKRTKTLHYTIFILFFLFFQFPPQKCFNLYFFFFSWFFFWNLCSSAAAVALLYLLTSRIARKIYSFLFIFFKIYKRVGKRKTRSLRISGKIKNI